MEQYLRYNRGGNQRLVEQRLHREDHQTSGDDDRAGAAADLEEIGQTRVVVMLVGEFVGQREPITFISSGQVIRIY